MNPFQAACIDACKRTLKSLSYHDIDFREVTGHSENYFVASVPFGEAACEIYVYVEEAGFGCNNNKDWHICEKPAYPNPQELITAFCSALHNKLSNTQ